jgi:hypothetical protein
VTTGGRMDYGKAFSYFTEDKDWINKFIIGSLLGIIPIVNFLATGYMLKIIDAEPDEKILPSWEDWGTLFKNGFFLSLTFLIYGIPIIIAGAVAIAFLVPLIIAVDKNLSPPAISIIMLVISGVFIFTYAVVLQILAPAIVLTYNETKSVGAALRVGEIFRITKKHFRDIIIIMLILWVVSIGIGTLASIPLLGFLVGIAGTFYSRLITGNLYSQLKRIVFPEVISVEE